jgi:hypothetical protein
LQTLTIDVAFAGDVRQMHAPSFRGGFDELAERFGAKVARDIVSEPRHFPVLPSPAAAFFRRLLIA